MTVLSKLFPFFKSLEDIVIQDFIFCYKSLENVQQKPPVISYVIRDDNLQNILRNLLRNATQNSTRLTITY